MKVYVVDGDTLYRLTEAKWMRVLRVLGRGKRADLATLSRPLGVLDKLPTREGAKVALRECYRRREREALGRLGRPEADGKLRWTRLAPGTYRALAADGAEVEVVKLGRDQEGRAVWVVNLNGEEVSAPGSLSKVEAQRAAQKLVIARAKRKAK